ncbi:MAG TPA: prepilin-type N-terminal cleavage/methylation domain-containing protein [bacterium]|nr:prepilin-type N-terminal cleavage/methylation domain-containing protein [bacterium]
MRLRSRTRTPGTLRELGNNRGFTLIEMMIASLTMVVALGVLLSFLRKDEKAREVSSHVIESRQNARCALDFIVSEIRMAGSGVSIPVVTSTSSGDSVIIYPVTPDSIGHRYEKFTLLEKPGDTETTLLTAMANASSVIGVRDTTGFAVGDLIVVTNGSFADLFEITAVDGGTKRFSHEASASYNNTAGHRPWPPGGYAVGSRVVKMSVITYYLDRGDSTCVTIMRQVGDSEPRVISDYVNAMELSYEMQDRSVVTMPANPMLIKNVIITIEAASDEPGGRHVTRLVSSAKPRCM